MWVGPELRQSGWASEPMNVWRVAVPSVDCSIYTHWRLWPTAGRATVPWGRAARSWSDRCCQATCWQSAAAPCWRWRRPRRAANSSVHCCDQSRWQNCCSRPCTSPGCDRWAPTRRPPPPPGRPATGLHITMPRSLVSNYQSSTLPTDHITFSLFRPPLLSLPSVPEKSPLCLAFYSQNFTILQHTTTTTTTSITRVISQTPSQWVSGILYSC